MEDVGALRALWVQHQAAAAREQELKLASWRADLSNELSRQAATLVEQLQGQLQEQQKTANAGLEAKIEALDNRLQECVAEGVRSEAAGALNELKLQQSAFEAVLRSDADKLRAEVAQLRAAAVDANAAAARQDVLDERLRAFRSEVAEAEKQLEARLTGEIWAVRDQAIPSRMEALRADVAAAHGQADARWQADLRALQLSAADLDGRLGVIQARLHRDDQSAALSQELQRLQGQVATSERRLTELSDRRSEELRSCLQQDVTAIQRRLQSQLRQGLVAAFQRHAAHALAQEWENRKSAMSQ